MMKLNHTKLNISIVVCIMLVAFIIWAQKPNTLVEDNSGLFAAEQLAQLEEYHTALRETFDIDLRIIIEPNTGDIDMYAAKAFKKHKVGDYSHTQKGLLLVVDPAQDRLRFEVGRNLEAVYTDAFVSYIERNQMVPFFKGGYVANGILATTELIVARRYEAADNDALDDSLYNDIFEPSTGAGASTDAHINKGYDNE